MGLVRRVHMLIKMEGKTDSESNYLDHLSNNVDIKRRKQHVCRCGKAFTRPAALTEHIKHFHLNLKDFMCQDCGSAFSSSSTLDTHKRSVHHKIKNHKCSECGLSFTTNAWLKTHIRTVHMKIKDY